MVSLFFEELRLQGYRSHADTLFSFGPAGVTLVRGDNGAGKTSLFSALNFCLFGDDVHEVLNKDLCMYGGKGCRLTLRLKVGDDYYLVCRQIEWGGVGRVEEYNVVSEGKNYLGVYRKVADTYFPVAGGKTKADVQEYLNGLLGIDARLFKLAFFYSQRGMRFVSVSDADKRVLLSNLFDLGYLSSARSRAKEGADELDREIYELNTRMESAGESIARQEALLAEATEASNKSSELNASRISDVKADLSKSGIIADGFETLLTKLKVAEVVSTERFTGVKKDATEAGDTVARLRNAFRDTANSIKTVGGQFDRFTAERVACLAKFESLTAKDSCDWCDRKHDEGSLVFLGEKYGKEADVLLKKIEVVSSELNKLRSASDQCAREGALAAKHLEAAESTREAVSKELDCVWQEMRNTETQLSVVKARVQTLGAELSHLENAGVPLFDIGKLEAEVVVMRKDLGKFSSDLEVLKRKRNLFSWWYVDGFASKGIMRFVFSDVLNDLNKAVVRYAESFGLSVVFSVDLEKASAPFSTMCYRLGKETKYNELSGGEKALLDIVMGFALHDIVCRSVRCNVLIMDEFFEGLDEHALSDAMKLLSTKAGDSTSVYVITHHRSFSYEGARSLYVRKEKEGSVVDCG